MNGYPLNGAALNGSSSLASYVYLPASTTGFEIAPSERRAVGMLGQTGMGLDATGDLSKVANLGTANTGMSLDMAGVLDGFTAVDLGSADTGMGLDATGTLFRVLLMEDSIATFGLDATGIIAMRGGLSGSLEGGLEIAGLLTARLHFGDSPIDSSLDASGSLSRTQFIAGECTVDLTPTGELTQGLRNYFDDVEAGFGLDAHGNHAPDGRPERQC